MTGRWIVRTRLLRFRGSLKGQIGNRRSSWSERESVLVALDDGVAVGLGEASPLPGYSPDTVEQCVAALEEIHRVLGPAPSTNTPEAILRAMVAPAVARLKGVPAAQFALETALWSWTRQRASDSASSAERRLQASNQHAARSFLLGGGSITPEQWAAEATARSQERAPAAVKVKVGRDDIGLDREIAGVRALRAALDPACELRLDANGAWSADLARANIARFADAGANSIEEPCAGEALLTLGRCALPWLADESLVIEGLAERALENEGCGGLVLKPALLGGVVRCLDLLRIAAERGKRCALSHLFDGPIALKMTSEIAANSPLLPLPSALGWHEGLSAWPRRLQRSRPSRDSDGPAWVHYALSASEWGLGL